MKIFHNRFSNLRYHELYEILDVGNSVCIYCSREKDTCEYIPPIEHAGAYPLDYDFLLVAVCEECKEFLANCVESTLAKRAHFLFLKYCEEYCDTLMTPSWSLTELQDMSVEFVEGIKPILEGKFAVNGFLDNLAKLILEYSELELPERPVPNNSSVSHADSALIWEEIPEVFCDLEAVDWESLEQEQYEEADNDGETTPPDDQVDQTLTNHVGVHQDAVELKEPGEGNLGSFDLPDLIEEATAYSHRDEARWKEFKQLNLDDFELPDLLDVVSTTRSSSSDQKNSSYKKNRVKESVDTGKSHSILKKNEMENSCSLEEGFKRELVEYVLAGKKGNTVGLKQVFCNKKGSNGRFCSGLINAYMLPSGYITYSCPVCRQKGVLKEWKKLRQKNRTLSKTVKSYKDKLVVKETMTSDMLCSTKGYPTFKIPLDIQILEKIVELVESDKGCSRTYFVAKYNDVLSVSRKFLTNILRQLIHYEVLDYSSGGLFVSPSVNLTEKIHDFVQHYPEIKRQVDLPQKVAKNKFPAKACIDLSHNEELQSASTTWVKFVRSSNLSVREANILVDNFYKVDEFLSASHSDFLSLPYCGSVTANKFCELKIVQANRLGELSTSPEKTLIARYTAFKKKYGKVPSTTDLGIKPSCELRKVINRYGGYTKYIFSIEGLKQNDLIDEFKRLQKKNSQMAPYKILEKYGQYPAWFYIRIFGTLKKFLQLAQFDREQSAQDSHAPKYKTANEDTVQDVEVESVEVDLNRDEMELAQSWQETILSFDLSVRAMRAMVDNFNSLEAFVNASDQDLDKMKRCGAVTKIEIKNFKEDSFIPTLQKTPIFKKEERSISEKMVVSDTQPIRIKKKKRGKILL